MSGVSVLVSAKSEEPRIGVVLQSLNDAKKAGIIQHILVLDDGSKDGTAKVCRAHNVPVLSLETNRGKAFGFVRGAFELAKSNPEYLVTLDGDLQSFRPSAIAQLLEPLQHDPSLGMVVAHTGPIWLSGQRAIRFSRLSPLFNSTRKWRRYLGYMIGREGIPVPIGRVGYGLEDSLNKLFGADTQKISVMGYISARTHQPVRGAGVQFIEGEFREAPKPYLESGPAQANFWNETLHANRVTQGRLRMIKVLRERKKKKSSRLELRKKLFRPQ